MVFSSAVFLFLFLPAVLVLYYLPVFFWNDAWETARKNTVLCLASLLFYAWGEPVYVILMLLSIAFNYYIGLDIGRHADHPSRQKIILAAAVVFDLLILGFFKYGNFLIDNLNGLLAWDIEPLQVSLPVGISFYTFQILSYVVDVYRGTVKPQKNPVAFAMYVTMFPQLIAGPIVQYADIEKRLGKRQVTPESFFDGVTVFLRGLGKKVLLANSFGAVWDEISAQSGNAALTAVIGAVAYMLQIYFDFSGYSDMAI
ncbi:MAG: MBOAT family protein, partial [Ruminococcus sp.]|nr:MBOAT family protein [Ruminococcus sp.]